MASQRAMERANNRRGRLGFAEIEIEGRTECPRCHVPFIPHLGNLIAPLFQCRGCNLNLTFRNSSAKVVKCPCCNFFRPLPNTLKTVICGGCEATIVYQKGDEAVKCCYCKHITIPTGDFHVFDPPFQAYQVVSTPPVNPVIPPPVNPVIPPRVNPVIPPPVNPVVPNQSNPIANAESESTATSSFISKPEGPFTIVADHPDDATDTVVEITKSESPNATIVVDHPDADSVAQIVINVAVRTVKRETEEDKTETESKRICRR